MTEREVTIRNIHTGEQYVPMLCIREPGQRTVPCIGGDTVNGLYMIKVPIMDHDHASIVEYHGAPYPIGRFLSLIRPIAARLGFGSNDIYTLLRSVDPYYVTVPLVMIGVKEMGEIHPDPVIDSGIDLKSICVEFKIDSVKARKKLRDAGMRAPYLDVSRIREILRSNS